MPRGSNMKQRKLNKQHPRLKRIPAPPVLSAKETPPEQPAPTKRERSLGLRNSLLREYGGEKPSKSITELVDFYCRCDEMKGDKSDDMKPKDLLGIFSIQKSILRMLQDLSGKSGQLPGDSNRNPYLGLTDEQLEAERERIDSLYRSLPKANSGPRLPDEGDDRRHSEAHLICVGHTHFKDGSWDYSPDAPHHIH